MEWTHLCGENMVIIDEKWIDDIWAKLEKKLSRIALSKRGTLPYTTGKGKSYDDKSKSDVSWWTNGFWPGMMWLMYDATKKETIQSMSNDIKSPTTDHINAGWVKKSIIFFSLLLAPLSRQALHAAPKPWQKHNC